ncbi:hypothetical protein GCM10025768_13140 [Microbacterium pseudoresistens]|nr:hypothetical protein [Microbacterium pseudoresistens]
MSLTKTVEPEALTADDREATYTFVVFNDGEVDLHDVTVTDPGPIGGTGTMGPIDCGGVTDLAVGDKLTCTAVYTAGLDDLDGSALENHAQASGVTPGGTQIGAEADAEVPTVLPNPALSLVKSADTDIATAAGQVITYAFTVTNTGNVTIADVSIEEGDFSGAGELGEIVCPAEAELLAPTDTVVCEAEYIVLAADLTGDALTNTASANGVGPFGPVTSPDSTAEVTTKAPSGPLAVTGGESALPYAAGGLLLVMLGVGTAVLARRRQHG